MRTVKVLSNMTKYDSELVNEVTSDFRYPLRINKDQCAPHIHGARSYAKWTLLKDCCSSFGGSGLRSLCASLRLCSRGPSAVLDGGVALGWWRAHDWRYLRSPWAPRGRVRCRRAASLAQPPAWWFTPSACTSAAQASVARSCTARRPVSKNHCLSWLSAPLASLL